MQRNLDAPHGTRPQPGVVGPAAFEHVDSPYNRPSIEHDEFDGSWAAITAS